MLELRTFGGLSVEANGAPSTGAAVQRKTLALLALLATAGKKGLSRDKLIAYLWPDSDAERGRNLLNQACYALRRDLRERDLFLGSTELRLNPAVVTSDIQAFEDAVRLGDLTRAATLYAGPFLDGFHADGAGEFEQWADIQRARLTNRVSAVFVTLATAAAARGDYRDAADWWRQLAGLDPLSSRAALGLMTSLAALGEVAEAVRQGRAYEALVRQELGTAPEASVIELTKRLRLEPSAAEGVTTDELRLSTAVASARRTVGYSKERAALRDALHSAVTGRGLVLSVAGEAGSGKTTLVEDFLVELVAAGRPCHIARGRCSERLAGSGAYLPLLDALEGLLRGDARGLVTRLMKELAPNWYAQVAPSLQPSGALGQALQIQAASQERLKRELNAFLREVCRLRPLIVFFDDVHWVDASTTDILGYVARQIGTAQMLIVTTYRPSELQLTKHPFGSLKLDLQAQGLCRDVPLELLTREDIEQFLKLEFPDHRFPPTFASFVHTKTEGSPLFMVDLLRYLRAKQVLAPENGSWKLAGSVPDLERELPESVRSMIQRKIEQLPEGDRQLLVAAAVQGYEFDSPIVTKVLDADAGDVEKQLEVLGLMDGFVRPLREHAFPDGTQAVRYRFVHVLYQNALYARLTPTRRASLSGAIAQALVVHYGERRGEVAAELALLFKVARDLPRAVEHFLLAAERAAGVFAHREAVVLAKRGLELLYDLPDSPARAGQELGLQLTLGFSLWVTNGYTDPDIERSMARAREICYNLGEIPQLFQAVYGLWGFYLVGAQMPASRQMAEQLLRMADRAQDPIQLYGAHTILGSSLHHLADLPAAHQHLERAIALYDPGRHDAYRALYRQELGPYTRCESLRVLWLLGYPDQALRRLKDAEALARQVSDPQAAGWPLVFGAFLHQHRREPELTQETAEACIAHSVEHGIAAHQQWGTIVRGWAVAQQGAVREGITEMRVSLTTHRVMRLMVVFPYFLSLLADALVKDQQIEEGLAVVREALEVAAATGQRFYEAELHRLRGELLLQGAGTPGEAETCFRDAVAIAGRQQAKSLELRAVTSLARLWREQDKRDEARRLLAPVYNWFTEGFDTRDLKDAKELLDALV